MNPYLNVLNANQFSLLSSSSLSRVFWFLTSFSFHKKITPSSPADAIISPSLFHLITFTALVCRLRFAKNSTLIFSPQVEFISQSFQNLLDISKLSKIKINFYSNNASDTSSAEHISLSWVICTRINWFSFMPRYFRCWYFHFKFKIFFPVVSMWFCVQIKFCFIIFQNYITDYQ